MSKNVIVNGTTYNNVTYVKLMQTSGTLTNFIDVDAVDSGGSSGGAVTLASGNFTLTEDQDYIEITNLAFTPRIFVVCLDSSTASDGLITIAARVTNDFAEYWRASSGGGVGTNGIAGTVIGSSGSSYTKVLPTSLTTTEDFGTSISCVYRKLDGIRIVKATGNPSFPWGANRKYNWFAIGWED